VKVAVLGAGAIGSYVGAALARGGAEVALIARGPHLAALREHGVTVHSPRGDFHADVQATEDPSEVGPVDVVFLGLKAYSYASAGPLLAPLLHDRTAVVAGQNGVPWWYFHRHGGPYDGRRIEAVDPGGATTAAIDPARAIGCVVYCSTELEAPGVVLHGEGTRFTLGEPDGSLSDRCAEISAAFRAGGLKAPVDARLRDQIWLKLLGNVAFNPITALTGATLGQLADLEEMRDLLRAIFAECAEIATTLGVELPVSLERRLEAGFEVGDHKTSMLQDLEAGKPLELDCMTGAVVELARRLEIAVPHTETVHACTRLLDHLTTRAAAR
jgi:2-dehydropantoate 2-reductase